ncbi:rna helicase [Moniliophthora roreri MCA 2997]|uniref:ATP-dependent RNA helicase n=2 Tax=Moniliophthora roreri TaxID=221103 RepID=V2X3D3_MONRO|nr:rna helicase [Moniliophthora roreri MCA 2997]KAI3607429.1 rna helicase [Moniliophthora roreri]
MLPPLAVRGIQSGWRRTTRKYTTIFKPTQHKARPTQELRRTPSSSQNPRNPRKSFQKHPEKKAEKSGRPILPSIKDWLSPGTAQAITDGRKARWTARWDLRDKFLSLITQITQSPVANGSAHQHCGIFVQVPMTPLNKQAIFAPAIEARLKSIEAAGTEAGAEGAGEPSAGDTFAHKVVGSLILTPSSTSALEVRDDLTRFNVHHPDLKVHLFVGGENKKTQLRTFMTGRKDFVVANTGRLLDVLSSQPELVHVLSSTRQIIIHEADKMVEEGLRDQISTVLSVLAPNPERRTFIFSETVTPGLRVMSKRVLGPEPTYLDCQTENVNLSPPEMALKHIPVHHTTLPTAEYQIPHIFRLIAHDQLVQPRASKIVLRLPTTKLAQLFSTLISHFAKSILPAGQNTNVYEYHDLCTEEKRKQIAEQFAEDKSGASILIAGTNLEMLNTRKFPGTTRVIHVGIPSGRLTWDVITLPPRDSENPRVDLVLLPWEIGYLSWQLTEIGMKPLTISELKFELAGLAQSFDESRTEIKGSEDFFQHPFTPLLEKYDSVQEAFAPKLDSEAIIETCKSMLGYYIPKNPELRVSNQIVVEGCKIWTVDAMGLAKIPHIDHSFLERMGISDHRTKHFGKEARIERAVDPKTPHWVGRGRVKKHRERMLTWIAKEYATTRIDDEETFEYRGVRYDRKPVQKRMNDLKKAGADEEAFESVSRRQ